MANVRCCECGEYAGTCGKPPSNGACAQAVNLTGVFSVMAHAWPVNHTFDDTASLFQNVAKNQDLRCVLRLAPLVLV